MAKLHLIIECLKNAIFTVEHQMLGKSYTNNDIYFFKHMDLSNLYVS